MTVTLSGEPKSTNHVYKFGRGTMYMTAEGKALKSSYAWQAKSQWKGKPREGDIELWVTFYFGTKRKRDLDNANKLWADALTGIVYNDDSQISHLHLERAYDAKNPRIEIEIV